MRLFVVALTIAGGMLVPGVADARAIDQTPECACQVFARHLDGSKKVRTQWSRWARDKAVKVSKGTKIKTFRSNDGRLNDDWTEPQVILGMHDRRAGETIEDRAKAYGRDINADMQKVCKSSEFMRKVCKAAKACVVAAAGTLYGALQAGENFWKAEYAAVVACQVAAVTVYFSA